MKTAKVDAVPWKNRRTTVDGTGRDASENCRYNLTSPAK